CYGRAFARCLNLHRRGNRICPSTRRCSPWPWVSPWPHAPTRIRLLTPPLLRQRPPAQKWKPLLLTPPTLSTAPPMLPQLPSKKAAKPPPTPWATPWMPPTKPSRTPTRRWTRLPTLPKRRSTRTTDRSRSCCQENRRLAGGFLLRPESGSAADASLPLNTKHCMIGLATALALAACTPEIGRAHV